MHRDLNPSNVVIGRNGRPVLLDWDEARRDSPLFDRAALMCDAAPAPLARAPLAWEVASGWHTEPDYARRLVRCLLAEDAAAAGGR